MIWYILWFVVGVVSAFTGDYLESKRKGESIEITIMDLVRNLLAGVMGLFVVGLLIWYFSLWKPITNKVLLTIPTKNK